MSDETDKQQSEEHTDEPRAPAGGERLAEARRELQISVHEIAKELHLDEHKVRAIERNEFDELGAPVFAKGHLKKYAQLVNIDPDDMLADYYAMNRATATPPPVVSERPRPRQELSPGPWIAVIVVAIIAVSAYWWFSRPDTAVEEVPAEPAVESAADTDIVEPPASDEDMVVDAPETGDDMVVPPSPQPTAVDEPVEETSTPDIAAGQVRVLLTYSGDCWTEITDANGRRLFFALGKDGREVEMTGAEPLSVLFGNPGNVSVVVNGEAFTLPATARPDRPLRLTLSGS